MAIRFDGRVAIVTGAGNGLGREYALALAERGAKVLVNDYAEEPAASTVEQIRSAGGEALAVAADVGDEAQVGASVARAVEQWGRIDILINNAGILRDTTFTKMTLADWDAVQRVHLTGSALFSMAVWPHMKAANYGRIVFTSSSSGLYGNFGQSNYGAAKTAMIGFMNVLHLEGAKNDIRVNTIAPGAATQMTHGLMPPKVAKLSDPKAVAPGVLYLVSEDAPSRAILGATAGGFARTYLYETEGVFLSGDALSPEGVAASWDQISDPAGQHLYLDGSGPFLKFLGKAATSLGISLTAEDIAR